MVGQLLARGMLAGVVAGLLTFGLAKVAGEPSVDQAIALEAHEHSHAGHGDAHEEEELVSRQTQAGLGLATGVVVFGTAVGGLFALVFAFAHGRSGRLGTRALAAWLALAAFIALVLVPSLKYPANPPAVGDPDTIGLRTGLHFLTIAISVALMVLASQLRRALLARLGNWNASIVAGLGFIAAVVAIQLALPTVSEVPADFPATLLWQFRMTSLGMQALLWSTIGLLFGWLAQRLLDKPTARQAG